MSTARVMLSSLIGTKTNTNLKMELGATVRRIILADMPQPTLGEIVRTGFCCAVLYLQ